MKLFWKVLIYAKIHKDAWEKTCEKKVYFAIATFFISYINQDNKISAGIFSSLYKAFIILKVKFLFLLRISLTLL